MHSTNIYSFILFFNHFCFTSFPFLWAVDRRLCTQPSCVKGCGDTEMQQQQVTKRRWGPCLWNSCLVLGVLSQVCHKPFCCFSKSFLRQGPPSQSNFTTQAQPSFFKKELIDLSNAANLSQLLILLYPWNKVTKNIVREAGASASLGPGPSRYFFALLLSQVNGVIH